MAKRLVVGIDGSSASAAAAAVWAGEEAAAVGADVLLLNVWQPPTGDTRVSPTPDILRLCEEEQLRVAAARLIARNPRLDVGMEQVTGTPATALVDAATAGDEIVLGSRRLGRIAGYLYGSVGLHVVAHSDCPVVLVRAPGSRPGGAGAGVVLALDLDRPSEALTAFAFEEASARGAALRVVYVWDVRGLYGYGGPMTDRQEAARMRHERGRELALFIEPWRAAFADVEVTADVVAGPVTDCLVKAGQDCALLVAGRRRRHLPVGVRIGPVTHAVVHHAPCPVAVVPHD